jgi:hypothetical protein
LRAVSASPKRQSAAPNTAASIWSDSTGTDAKDDKGPDSYLSLCGGLLHEDLDLIEMNPRVANQRYLSALPDDSANAESRAQCPKHTRSIRAQKPVVSRELRAGLVRSLIKDELAGPVVELAKFQPPASDPEERVRLSELVLSMAG